MDYEFAEILERNPQLRITECFKLYMSADQVIVIRSDGELVKELKDLLEKLDGVEIEVL